MATFDDHQEEVFKKDFQQQCDIILLYYWYYDTTNIQQNKSISSWQEQYNYVIIGMPNLAQAQQQTMAEVKKETM